MNTKEDNELVFEVIRGNISSFEVLIDRYQTTIFKIVLKMVVDVETAKDLTQDVFVKVYEKMGSFNDKFRFFSRIYRIAINESINWIKQNPRMTGLEHAISHTSDDDSSGRNEMRSKIVNDGLQELTPDYKSLLLLRYFSGLTYQEISEIKGISSEKVKSRLFIAREKLQKIVVRKGILDNE